MSVPPRIGPRPRVGSPSRALRVGERRPVGPAARTREFVLAWGIPEWFVISQTLLPALLMLPGTQALRFPIRMAPFVVPLLLLVVVMVTQPRSLPPHPARRWLIAAVLWLAALIAHPSTQSVPAGVATVLLYLAVLSPLFWAPPLVRDARHLARVLAIALACNGFNAVIGILQVYDPGTWMPPEFSRIQTGSYVFDALGYIGPHDRVIMRPPGLFDNPGAVCGPGMMAALFGLVFVGAWHSTAGRVLGALLAVAGVAAIFLSYVRTAFAIFLVMLIAYVWALAVQGRTRRAAGLFGLGALFVAGALSLAVTLGGDAIVERFASLFADDPVAVYYDGLRGEQLEWAFTNYLVEYPLGAGLGRWGMVNYYFGDPASLIWAELQPSAWIVDGGAPLVLLYAIALLVTTLEIVRVMRGGDADRREWAAAIFAATLGTIVLAFGFTPFNTQVGLQFWFLIGALHGAATQAAPVAAQRVRPR